MTAADPGIFSCSLLLSLAVPTLCSSSFTWSVLYPPQVLNPILRANSFSMGKGFGWECHKSVLPKNWKKKIALYSESHFTSLGFSSPQALCAFAVPKGEFQVEISSVNILRDFFSVPKIQAIHHCQETAILFSSVGRL